MTFLPHVCTIMEAHNVINIVPTPLSITIDIQLKSDILNEALSSVDAATSPDKSINLEESSDPLHPYQRTH